MGERIYSRLFTKQASLSVVTGIDQAESQANSNLICPELNCDLGILV